MHQKGTRIEVLKNNIDYALREFNSKVKAEGILSDYSNKQYYESRASKKRRKTNKVIYDIRKNKIKADKEMEQYRISRNRI